jgi:hypothetical protein
VKLIGLSLSFCMKDIHNGVVNPDDVMFIVSGTKFPDVEHVFGDLGYSYADWAKSPTTRELVRRMWISGKIIQPRMAGQHPPNLGNGHWACVDRLENLDYFKSE